MDNDDEKEQNQDGEQEGDGDETDRPMQSSVMTGKQMSTIVGKDLKNKVQS